MLKVHSFPPSYFEAKYRADIDPWRFRVSDYEKEKYRATTGANEEALPARFGSWLLDRRSDGNARGTLRSSSSRRDKTCRMSLSRLLVCRPPSQPAPSI